jgi:hypothetical protein
MKNQWLLFFSLMVLFAVEGNAQGCSDAGVCSMGNTTDSLSNYQNGLEVQYGYAIGLDQVTYQNAVVGFEHKFNNNWSGSTQITYNQAHGNFGTRGQLGDIFLLARYKRKMKSNGEWLGAFGAKIPLHFANLKINNISLPMEYQSSLGTFDALLSAVYRKMHWQFEGAFQIPVVQSNRNSYFDEYSASDVFPMTNLFRRKPDALVRITYKWSTANDKWQFRPNAMAIYHLGQDTYEDVFGKSQSIENSQGITINMSWVTLFKINQRNTIELNLAAPLVVRQVRPDGLTRAFVSSLAYSFQF